MPKKSTEKQPAKKPAVDTAPYVPYRETFEGIVERVEDLEYWRDNEFEQFVNELIPKKITIDETLLDQLRADLEAVEDKANELEKAIKLINPPSKYQTFTFDVRVRCPHCHDPAVIVKKYLGSDTFECECDECSYTFEHQVMDL